MSADRLNDLRIERGVTGFIVYEDGGMGMAGRKWAFETPEKLAEFVADWGRPIPPPEIND